jgi:TadE-like protein
MEKVLNHRRARSQLGQAMIEFIIIFWFAFSFLMLVIQISLMFNAHSMMKLAAYNAARAAIVTRSGDGPEKPVKLGEMKDAAKKAAFLTILPVIPGMHARVQSFTGPRSVLSLFTDIPADAASIGLSAALKGHARGAIAAAVEFLGFTFSVSPPFFQSNFKVKFVNPAAADPGASSAEITSIPQKIEFDDTSKNDLSQPGNNNLIKVVVEWQYPLVIPFADQIIYAYTHPIDLMTAYAVSGQAGIAADIAIGNTPLGQSPLGNLLGLGQYRRRPVWEVGWVFRDSPAASFLVATGFRIPIRTSYVMRMQWDRGPDS